MTLDELDTLLDRAVEAAAAAAKVCEAVRADGAGPGSTDKADRSPVTVADFASQAVVAAAIKASGLPLVAEESAAEFDAAPQELRNRAAAATGMLADELRQNVAAGAGEPSGRYWVLDPIDGTKGFLRGGQYAVALALVDEGRPVLGVLACPGWDVGRLFGGIRDSDAWSAPITYPEQRQPITAVGTNEIVRLVESVESGHSDHDRSARLAEAIGATEEPLRMDSQAKYAAVACGEADVYLRLPTRAGYEEKVWDHAAGLVVVEAAGGRVSDLDGKPLDFTHGRTLQHNRGVVCTGGTGELHDRVLQAVASEAPR